MTHRDTHLFDIVLLSGPANLQQSECLTKRVWHAPPWWEKAYGNRLVGWFGSSVDFLAEVCAQNDITAETFHGKTLPAKRQSSSVFWTHSIAVNSVLCCILLLDPTLSYCRVKPTQFGPFQ